MKVGYINGITSVRKTKTTRQLFFFNFKPIIYLITMGTNRRPTLVTAKPHNCKHIHNRGDELVSNEFHQHPNHYINKGP